MSKVLKKTVRERKKQLRNLHECMSWRVMARDIYGGHVTHSVLQRFATEKDYVPADENLLQVLELITPPNLYRSMPRWWERTPKALEFFMRTRGQVKMMFDEAKRERLRALAGLEE